MSVCSMCIRMYPITKKNYEHELVILLPIRPLCRHDLSHFKMHVLGDLTM